MGLLVGGSWYWNRRPADVQAVIAGARDASRVRQVMTVESISEGSESIVGGHVAIVRARVTAVTGPRTFWVEGDEDEPLLIVLSPSRGFEAKLAADARVSIIGVVRDGSNPLPLSSEDHAEVAKASCHVEATSVGPVR